MIEPLTAATIATLVLTKAFEKTGEKLGEKVLEESGKLARLLHHKFPGIATAIEQSQQQFLDEGQSILVEQQVQEAVKADPEVAQAVQSVAEAVQSQPANIQNFTKLAEKIGMVVQGGTVHAGDLNF